MRCYPRQSSWTCSEKVVKIACMVRRNESQHRGQAMATASSAYDPVEEENRRRGYNARTKIIRCGACQIASRNPMRTKLSTHTFKALMSK